MSLKDKLVNGNTFTPEQMLDLASEMARAIKRVRALHYPDSTGRHCYECTRIVKSVTQGQGSAQYPCPTILFLDGEQG